jgi:PleD family two-component response regulator
MLLRAFLAGISLNGSWIAACRPMGKPDFSSKPIVLAGALRMNAKIPIIDDEADIRKTISKILTMDGYRFINAPEKAGRTLHQPPPDPIFRYRPC